MLITDNHKSEVIFLTDVEERTFDNINEAIKFLSECTNSITKAEDLLPELKRIKKPKSFSWIISEAQIKPKHILLDNIEIYSNRNAMVY